MFLKRNKISSLPLEILILESLEELDLSENNFNYIPSSIFMLKNLEKANFNLNRIELFQILDHEKSKYIVPRDYRFNIKYLFLVRNSIRYLPNDYILNDNFKNIEHLALDENPIKQPNKELLYKIKQSYKYKITFQYEKESKMDEENNLEGKLLENKNEETLLENCIKN